MPSSIEIFGVQLISFLILEIFANDLFGSPGRLGTKIFFPPNI